MANKLIAECLVKDILFDSHVSLDAYLDLLQHRRCSYKVISVFPNLDGSVMLRVIVQVAGSSFLNLEIQGVSLPGK